MKHADVGIMNRTSIWLNGIMGFAIGDALGAPAEFGERWNDMKRVGILILAAVKQKWIMEMVH